MMETMRHVEGWAGLWSSVASLIFLWSMAQQHVPYQLKDYLRRLADRLHDLLSPYDTISMDERTSRFFGVNPAYEVAEAYLGDKCTSSPVHSLRATLDYDADRMTLSIDDYEEIVDDFRGAKVWWTKSKVLPSRSATTIVSMNGTPGADERRLYYLTFHRRHRTLVENDYLLHVLAEGRANMARNRTRRLFTNKPRVDWSDYSDVWNDVKFEHPATFATLGMDPVRKQEVIDDLEMFRDGKDYYASVGKAWKRGYLLFGPPGTGKSTMVAAMANLLDYDVYDLELTAVKNNTDLRRLFMEMEGKSILVIEDIDCSVDLTGKRRTTNNGSTSDDDDDGGGDDDDKHESGNKKGKTKVTLSGVLNCVDGLWSACGGERIIVFTTNHKENLDPALIRRGRMDMHIEMSYCCFESFKVLAMNYLGVADHRLFGDVRQLLGEVSMSPADVAENLMPKTKEHDVDACLDKLVKALQEAKKSLQKEKKSLPKKGGQEGLLRRVAQPPKQKPRW